VPTPAAANPISNEAGTAADLPAGFSIPASGEVSLGSIGLVSGAGAVVFAYDQPTVTATIGAGKTVNITGNLSVKTRVYQRADVDGSQLTIALLGGVGVINPTALSGKNAHVYTSTRANNRITPADEIPNAEPGLRKRLQGVESVFRSLEEHSILPDAGDE